MLFLSFASIFGLLKPVGRTYSPPPTTSLRAPRGTPTSPLVNNETKFHSQMKGGIVKPTPLRLRPRFQRTYRGTSGQPSTRLGLFRSFGWIILALLAGSGIGNSESWTKLQAGVLVQVDNYGLEEDLNPKGRLPVEGRQLR